MTIDREVWLLCLVSANRAFPNLSVLGIFTTEEAATSILRTLPRENCYNLYKASIDQFVGFFNKNGKLQDGMGQLWHEHFVPEGTGWQLLDSDDEAPPSSE